MVKYETKYDLRFLEKINDSKFKIYLIRNGLVILDYLILEFVPGKKQIDQAPINILDGVPEQVREIAPEFVRKMYNTHIKPYRTNPLVSEIKISK